MLVGDSRRQHRQWPVCIGGTLKIKEVSIMASVTSAPQMRGGRGGGKGGGSKGGGSGRPANAPSTTGNPSGGGRGNNPPSK